MPNTGGDLAPEAEQDALERALAEVQAERDAARAAAEEARLDGTRAAAEAQDLIQEAQVFHPPPQKIRKPLCKYFLPNYAVN